MKEFPKMLYKDGNPLLDYVTVDSGKEESELNAEGYSELTASSFEPDSKAKSSSVKHGESTALVDPVLTTLAAEKPEDGNIYATSGSAPTPDFPLSTDQTTVEKTTRPVGRPRKD